jgi:hypothetical protein
MKDYFDNSMKEYVSQTVSDTIEMSVNPLSHQMTQMTETFASFCSEVTRSLAEARKDKVTPVPSTSTQLTRQPEGSDEDFIEVATDGYLSLNEDLLSEGELPQESDRPETGREVKSFTVVSDKGSIGFEVDITDPNSPKIPYKERVEMMAKLTGEICVSPDETVIVPGAAHWFSKGKDVIKGKSTLQVPAQFHHLVQTSVEAMRNLARKKAFPKPPKPSTIAIVQEGWAKARVPLTEFNKLCFKDCVPQLPSTTDHLKVTPNQMSEMEAGVRDAIACTTYLMRVAQSVGSLQDHFCDEAQDMTALQIVITSLLDLQVAATDQLHKDLAYLFTSITLLRRDLYLGGLHKAISTSATA